MEKIVKKVKDFEEVLFASSEYAENQLKKFKVSDFVESGGQVAQQLKRYAMAGIGKNDDLDKDNIDYKNSEDEIDYNKGNGSKNSFKGEFKDSLDDFVKQDCKKNQNEQTIIEGFNLRDAMIAKEILDKPLCKRGRRGFRGGR